MTEAEAKAKVIAKANGEVGTKEGANNWNKYAAELDPLKITFGNKQNAPWCAELDLWLFVTTFGVDDGLKMLCSPKPTAIPLCASGAQYFKNAGQWSSTPELGAIVFYYANGAINHQGIVTGVSGLSITTVEGNYSDKVARVTHAIKDSTIAGYGIPKWSIAAEVPVDPQPTPTPTPTPSPTPTPTPTPTPSVKTTNDLPTLRKGNKGEVVRAAQFLLNGRDCSVGRYGADGDFGNMTYAAVLAFQRRNGLTADGIIGSITWAYLLGLG